MAVTGEICVDIDKLPTKELEYKKQQCRRLLDCVSQYSLYDLFVYFFADDIGALGLVQKEEKVIVWDENFLVGTGESIQMKIKTLTDSLRRLNFTDTDISWVGQCDDLLKEFHKFNEGASESGRWQGGTVTQVCKGWSTSKVNLSLHVQVLFLDSRETQDLSFQYISFESMADLLIAADMEKISYDKNPDAFSVEKVIKSPEKVIAEIFSEFATCAVSRQALESTRVCVCNQNPL